MKKIVLICFMSLFAMFTWAQTANEAKKVLDKTASVVGRKGGASASFKVSSTKYGNTSGTISIKGNKFHAKTPQAIVWFDGKTQWTYMNSTEEVNIITPNEAQQAAMNPYQFINLYKSGFDMSMKTVSGRYQVLSIMRKHLVTGNLLANLI